MFHIARAQDVLHQHVVSILDPAPYQQIVNAALFSQSSKHYLPEHKLYVDETISTTASITWSSR